MSAVPPMTPVTIPVAASTVAIASSLDVHSTHDVPSEEIVVVQPGDTVCVPDNVPAVGLLTVAITSSVPEQPTEFVTTTV